MQYREDAGNNMCVGLLPFHTRVLLRCRYSLSTLSTLETIEVQWLAFEWNEVSYLVKLVSYLDGGWCVCYIPLIDNQVFLVKPSNSMLHALPWKVDSYSGGQTLKVQYLVHKYPPVDLILSQLNPVHSHPSDLFKTDFNVIPDARLCLLSGSLLISFPSRMLYAFNISPMLIRVAYI